MGASLDKPWVLRLYVTDASPKSARAIVNVRRLLEEHLGDRYTLEILNIAEHVAQADGRTRSCACPRCCAWRRRRRAASSATCRTRRACSRDSTSRRRAERDGMEGHVMGTDLLTRCAGPAPRRRPTNWRACARPTLELESRLAEAEDTLAAIRNGDVDALIVGDGHLHARQRQRRQQRAAQGRACADAGRRAGVRRRRPRDLHEPRGRGASTAAPRRRRWACPAATCFASAGPTRNAHCTRARHCALRAAADRNRCTLRIDGREMHVECTVSTLRTRRSGRLAHSGGDPQHRRPRAGPGDAGGGVRHGALAARAPVRHAGGELARHLRARRSRPAPSLREPGGRALQRRAGGRPRRPHRVPRTGMPARAARRVGPRGAQGIRQRRGGRHQVPLRRCRWAGLDVLHPPDSRVRRRRQRRVGAVHRVQHHRAGTGRRRAAREQGAPGVHAGGGARGRMGDRRRQRRVPALRPVRPLLRPRRARAGLEPGIDAGAVAPGRPRARARAGGARVRRPEVDLAFEAA
jgi:hypothetical protein